MPESIPSPCIMVCLFDGPVCTGCGMTNDESSRWARLTREERIHVLQRLGKWPLEPDA